MFKTGDMSRLLILPAAVAALILLPSCGGDDGGNQTGPETFYDTFPASWGGQWHMVMTGTEQQTGLTTTYSETGLICPGATADFVGEIMTATGSTASFTVTCDAAISDSNFEITCSGPGTSGEMECMLDVQLSGPRDGDSFMWTGEMGLSCEVQGLPDPIVVTIDIVVEGTRTSTSTEGCPGGALPRLLPADFLTSLLP